MPIKFYKIYRTSKKHRSFERVNMWNRILYLKDYVDNEKTKNPVKS